MTKVAAVETTVEEPVHFMKKSHMLISKGHIDLENLNAFEAASITAVFVLATLAGVATQANLFS